MKRKKLLYRSGKMGSIENDQFFGKFAATYLDALNDHELDLYEELLNQNDVTLFRFISNQENIPEKFNHSVMRKLLEFRNLCAKK